MTRFNRTINRPPPCPILYNTTIAPAIDEYVSIQLFDALTQTPFGHGWRNWRTLQKITSQVKAICRQIYQAPTSLQGIWTRIDRPYTEAKTAKNVWLHRSVKTPLKNGLPIPHCIVDTRNRHILPQRWRSFGLKRPLHSRSEERALTSRPPRRRKRHHRVWCHRSKRQQQHILHVLPTKEDNEYANY